MSLSEGSSGSRAFSSRLFIGLQGQLNVARPLGLFLGIDLQGQGSKFSKVIEVIDVDIR